MLIISNRVLEALVIHMYSRGERENLLQRLNALAYFFKFYINGACYCLGLGMRELSDIVSLDGIYRDVCVCVCIYIYI